MWNFAYIGPAQTAEEALERLGQVRGQYIAVDTETIGLKGDKSTIIPDWDEEGNQVDKKIFLDAKTCIGFGLAVSDTEGWYFPLGNGSWQNVPVCDPLPGIKAIGEQGNTPVFFNSMFDLERLEDALDLSLGDNFEDVAIASQVQGLWNSLDQNSGHLLCEDHTVIDEVMPKGKTMLDVKYAVTARKCIEDCFTTLKLFRLYKMPEWKKRESLVWTDRVSRQFDVSTRIIECYEVDRKCVQVLRKMSHRGLALRPQVVQEWYTRLKTELNAYDTFFAQQGINPQSNDQVGTLLARRGYWLRLTDSKKHYKVDEETLLGLKDPVAYMVLARRRRQKLLGTYVQPNIIFNSKGQIVDYLDRCYTHFRLDLATGRLGSFEFNIQNQPPKMRVMYKPDTGTWTWADLHQAEMRVWAWQAQDEVMLKAFSEGSSPHVETLHYLFPGVAKSNPDGSSTTQYVDSKSFNFALLADASDDILARTTKRPVALVAKLKQELYTLYWKSRLHQDYMRQRHQPWFYPDYVEDDFGRRCHIPDASLIITSHHQEKCRLNYPFQSTVASAVKRQMIGLDASGYDQVAQIHDEILFDGNIEVPNWIDSVHPAIGMPFEVDHAANWI